MEDVTRPSLPANLRPVFLPRSLGPSTLPFLLPWAMPIPREFYACYNVKNLCASYFSGRGAFNGCPMNDGSHVGYPSAGLASSFTALSSREQRRSSVIGASYAGDDLRP